MNESALLSRYWAKADPNSGIAQHHSFVGHSLDVAACGHVLVQQSSLLRRQLSAHLDVEVDRVAPTIALALALHDLGKLDTRFQRKAPVVADRLRPESAGLFLGSYDHGVEGFRQVEDDAIACQRILDLLGPGGLRVLRAVTGHHGTLPTRAEPDPSRIALPVRLRREDRAARAEYVELAASFFSSLGAHVPLRSDLDGPLVQRLAGLCAVADWVGSNVTFFPYHPEPIADLAGYWEERCGRAETALEDSGLFRGASAGPGFGALFPGFQPRDVQLLTEAVATERPALVVVEGEMGKGKTEAALALAARFLGAGHAEGITILLPTMATSNAMFGRVEEVAGRLFRGGTVQLALAHGRASREPRFQSLIRRSLRATDPDAVEASVACARWLLSRKRILLAQLGVGTIDQALQAALILRHQFVRLFGLCRNVVVIDEVHAYDAYMEVLLEHLLSWLGALEVPVILLSATLPEDRRQCLARAWAGGAESASASFREAAAADYPLVSVTHRDGTTAARSRVSSVTRTIHVEYVDWPAESALPFHATVARLLSAARAGARVVWIRNTVGEAQDAFEAVEAAGEGVERALFHSRFRACDRRAVEREVLARFGKGAPPGGRMLIATQVVEQSLDLDFDELHTDLAPIDLVLQRAGRLHRHQRTRPDGFTEAHLVVHGPDEARAGALAFGKSQHVYDVGTLWLARRALRSRRAIVLPGDIRSLIEQTYHPDERQRALAEGGAALIAKEQRRAADLEAKRTRARRVCIDPVDGDPDGAAALADDDEDAVHAFTRDGQSTTLLPLHWDGARGFGLGRNDAPWHLDATRPDAWALTGELLDDTLSYPGQRGIEGIADGAWDAWCRRFARFAEESGLGARVVPLPLRPEADGHAGLLRFGSALRRVHYSSSRGLRVTRKANE